MKKMNNELNKFFKPLISLLFLRNFCVHIGAKKISAPKNLNTN